MCKFYSSTSVWQSSKGGRHEFALKQSPAAACGRTTALHFHFIKLHIQPQITEQTIASGISDLDIWRRSLMLNLIEHVADPLEVLQMAQSLLAPGGIIVIKTPNTDSWDARLYKKSYWGGLHCPRHWVIFSEKSFRLLLQSTALKIKKITYTQGAPFWAFSIIAALHRRKIVRISTKKPIIFHWLFAPISAVFAVFDFIRRPFAKTSQLFNSAIAF